MSRPTTRLLTVLELLQTHGRMPGSELARRLEVDQRTVRRYITMLEDLGVPVTAERGRDGAYLLVSGFKLPPMMFTDDEALALSVGLIAARGLGLAGAVPSVASAQAKLERVMPASVKRRVRAIDETVALDLHQPTTPRDNTALTILSAAAQRQQRVHLVYISAPSEHTERDFDPYAVAYRGGRWYVVGMCHLRRGLRSFRLDRVAQLWPLEMSFERPLGFDALSYLTRSLATLPRAFTIEVLLMTDLSTARRSLFAAAGVLESTDGGVLLRSQADDLGWFARELSRLPFAFKIRTPASLRKEVCAHATRLLRNAKRLSASRRASRTGRVR